MATCKHSFTWTANSTGPFNPPVNYLTWCPSCGTWGRWDGSKFVAQTESPGSLAMENAERFGDALGRIFAILGPSAPECEGCGAEISAALKVIEDTMLMRDTDA